MFFLFAAIQLIQGCTHQTDGIKKMQILFRLLVVHVIWALQCVGIINASEGCSGRVVLNTTTGYISDGIGNYPAPSHCEWLIDGKFFC